MDSRCIVLHHRTGPLAGLHEIVGRAPLSVILASTLGPVDLRTHAARVQLTEVTNRLAMYTEIVEPGVATVPTLDPFNP